jgi:hypothetical protein
MKVLRALASIVVFLILCFFLIGVNASNDWEDGAGAIAKVILIPICLLLGLLLFKLAAPLFGASSGAILRDDVKIRTQRKISGSRYRMGNDLPTSYALAAVGGIIVLVAISRRDMPVGITGVGLLLFSVRMRARLQSEKNAARSLGARTFEDDVHDAVIGAGEATGALMKFAFDRGVSGLEKLASKIDESVKGNDKPEKSQQHEKWPTTRGSTMTSFEQTGVIDMLRQLGFPENQLRNATPIASARSLLACAWTVFSSDRSQQGIDSSQVVIVTAMKSLAWALNSDSGVEMMSGGRTLDRCDALMWYGICAGLLVPPTQGQLELSSGLERPTELAALPDVMALAVAHDAYLQAGDLKRAGRCAPEAAEIMRLRSLPEADRWFDRADQLFRQANLPDRVAALMKSRGGSARETSPFFYQAMGPGPTTVAGSLEYATMGSATYLMSYDMPDESSDKPQDHWLRIGQRVRIATSSQSGEVIAYLGQGLVAIKVDVPDPITGIQTEMVHWSGLVSDPGSDKS